MGGAVALEQCLADLICMSTSATHTWQAGPSAASAPQACSRGASAASTAAGAAAAMPASSDAAAWRRRRKW